MDFLEKGPARDRRSPDRLAGRARGARGLPALSCLLPGLSLRQSAGCRLRWRPVHR